jgi:CSLREA domain-containing protein
MRRPVRTDGRMAGWRKPRAAILLSLPIVAALAVLALPTAAPADPGGATIVVTTTADDDTASVGDCTLRDAIAAANTDAAVGGCSAGSASGTDTIEALTGTYFLDDGQLLISSDLNLVGAGARSTVISGTGSQRDLEISSGNVTIGGVTIENGSTSVSGNESNPGVGGGIWVDQNGALTLQDSTVIDNHADQSGGGIDNDGSLTVVRSTIENNQAGCGVISCGLGIGGGIDDFGASLSISDSTITANEAQSDGGGLYLGGPSTLTNDTIAQNQADIIQGEGAGGGGITVQSTVSLANTLLAGNTWNGDAGNCSSAVTSLGGNLDDGATCGLNDPTDQSGVDPQLGGVDSSGPTDVLPLLSNSPAIDAGNLMACPATDQRYIARPQGSGCDVGAYEFTATAPSDYYVSTTDELAAALAEAEGFEVPATIHIAAGHYDIGNLTGTLGTGAGLTFAGAGAAGTILDGDGSTSEVFDIGGSATTTIKGVTVENSTDTGIYDNGTLVLDDSIVQDNASLGILSTNAGLDVSGSTISGNGDPGTDSESNGGIYVESPFSAVNTTIAGNNGHGIAVDYVDTGASLNNVTIAGNNGDGLFLFDAISATNTIVANNAAGDCVSAQTYLTSDGHNLDSDGSCFSYQEAAGDLTADPQLGPLQDNGGATPTMALASGSPAVDAGNDASCSGVDQRGTTRPQGPHCDIGAFELVPSPGLLSGSVSTNGEQNANLTALGGEDWVIWGYAGQGTSTSLVPDVRKAGGSAISDLTDVNPTSTVLRGLGQFGGQGILPYSFDWSDGSGPASATGAFAGLEHDGQQTSTPTQGDGFSFTVPASTVERTLTVFTSEHFGTGTLTASLSDGSAQSYTQSVDGSPDLPSFGGNAPGIFTIHYKAASAGQHLTVSWTESAANCPGFACDDAAIYAVALSGGGNATSASASLSSDESVPMAASNVPIADIPLVAFDPQPPGSPGLQLNGLQLNGLQLNGLQLNGLQLNGLQLNGLQLNGLQLNGLQLNGLQLNGLQLNGLQLNGLQLNGLQLNGLPLDPVKFPDGWAGILAGTDLANQPLQTITLSDVLDVTSPPEAVAKIDALTIGDFDLSGSALGQVTLGSLALSGTQLNGLPTEYQNAIWAGLSDWCQQNTTDPSTACGPSGDLSNFTLLQLALAGAPVQGLQLNGLQLNGLQLNGLQLNGLQLNGLSTSASGIAGMQLNGLQLNGLPLGDLQLNGLQLNGLQLNGLFDCTLIDCTLGTTATLADAQAAGAILPGTTLGDLDPYFGNLTIADLLQSVLGPDSIYKDTATFADLIGLFIPRSSIPWETLSPETLSLFDKNRPTMNLTAGFTLQGSGTPSADVTVKIPDGFDYDPNSATLSENGNSVPVGEPSLSSDGHTLDWQLDSLDVDVSYELAFKVRSGTTVGPAQATETVTSGSQTDTSTASFTVEDSYQGNSDPGHAHTITADTGVQLSALPQPGAVDWYRIPMPPAGTRIHVHLTDLPADYDLALYSSTTTSVRTGGTDQQQPLQDGVVPDSPIDVHGGSNGQLTPTALQDVPSDPGVPLVQVSANRGTDDEEVGFVSPGGVENYLTFAVFGYNGAFSPKPYSLRVTTTPPPATLDCPARTLAGGGATIDPLPDLGSLPPNLNTIILVNEKRLGDTYGSTAESNAVMELNHLASQDGSLGVKGVVVPVEAIGGVQALYDQWDQNPCDNGPANAIANKIADEVDAIKAAASSVKYIVFAGGDDQIPFFRVPDLTLLDNESGFAAQFGANEYHGALAAGDLLSDNPYLDTRPVPASGRELFVPDLVGGRLVETADDIASAVTSFESSGGILRSSTGFVSGYDFVADGSQQVADRLSALGVSVSTLDNPLSPNSNWGIADLFAAAFPSGGPADINDWNGHYDNTRALMANQQDLLSTSDLTGSHALDGGIFFTMGCHAGFQTTDVVVGGAPVLDWAQYFAGTHTGFVGNTGFGYGSTDSASFSEELMTDLAGQLGGSVTLGQALTQAKDEYYLSRIAFSVYDEKTLSEAELYGLPMYGVGQAPQPLADPPPDPVPGTSQSTSPSQGSLSPFTTGVESASFSATPSFSPLQHGTDGDFFTNAGQVQAPNYRPLQPYVSLPATRTDGVAHGVVIDSLTSEDHSPFNPDNNRPILDASASEPEPQFGDEAWPEKIPTLASLGSDQSLNLATGQFFTDTSGNTPTGVERLWTQIDGRVTYSNSLDFTPPTIDSIDAFLGNGAVAFTGTFSDLDENGDPGTVAFAQVVYDDGSGNWNALQLTYDSNTGTWSGGAPFSGQHVQFFVEACDTAGNCGYSSNKGRYFDAQPLPLTNGTLALTPDHSPTVTGWYTDSVDVTATTSAQTVQTSVDGGSFTADSAITLAGDGVHIVQARDSDGNTATGVYLIDKTPPTTPAFTGIAGGINPVNDLPLPDAIGCTSSDATSGLRSCVVTGYSSTVGMHMLTATATDNAGNTSTATLTYTVGFQAGDILAPVTAPSGDQTDPNASDLQVFKIKSTVPLKFQFYLDAARTTPMTTPPAGSIAYLTVAKHDGGTDSEVDETTLTTGNSDTGNQFRWSGGQYIYNMSTKPLTAGTYWCQITLKASDGTVLGQSAKQYFVLRK